MSNSPLQGVIVEQQAQIARSLLAVATVLLLGVHVGAAQSPPSYLMPAGDGCLRLSLLGEAWGQPGEFPYSHSVLAGGDLAVVSDDSRVRIVDLTRPESPQVVGQVSLSWARLVGLAGHHVYALSARKLYRIDVAVPTTPTVEPVAMEAAWTFSSASMSDDDHLVGLGSPPDSARAQGDRPAQSEGQESVVVLDVSASPAQVTSLVPVPNGRAMAMSNGWTYVETVGQLQVVDVRDPARAAIVASVSLPTPFQDANSIEAHVLAGQRSVVVTASSPRPLDAPTETTSLAFVDAGDPRAATVKRQLTLAGRPPIMQLAGDTFLVLAEDTTYVIDAADPAAPNTVPAWIQRGSTKLQAVAMAGGRLLVTGYGQLLTVYEFNRDAVCEEAFPESPPPDPRPAASRLLLPVVLDGRFQRQGAMRDVDPIAQTGGFVRTALLSGQTAYLAVGPGLAVVDVSDPDAPRTLAQGVPCLGSATYLAMAGRVLYATTVAGSVQAFDVSDPTSPREVARLRVPGGVRFAGVVGQSLLIGTPSVVTQIDVSRPAAPRPTANVFPPRPAVVFGMAGTHLYALLADRSLWQYDPRSQVARLVDSLNIAGGSNVALSGTSERLYVSTGDQIHTYSLANGEPVRLSSIPVGLTRLVVGGSRLYGLDGRYQLVTFDLSDPDRPRESATLDALGWSYLAGSEDRVVLMGLSKPGLIVDTTVLDRPRPAAQLMEPWMPANVLAVAHDVAYADVRATGRLSATWRIVEYSGQGMLQDIGPLFPDGRVPHQGTQQAFRQGTTVYVVSQAVPDNQIVVDILDVTDPQRPQQVRTLHLAGDETVAKMTSDGPRLYLWRRSADRQSHRIEIFDLAIGVPDPVSSIDLLPPEPSWPALAAAGGYLYFSDATGVRVFDVRDATNPRAVGRQDLLGGIVDLQVADERLYALTSPGSVAGNNMPRRQLTILALDDPAAPLPLGAVVAGQTPGNFDYAAQLSVANGIAVASAPNAGVDVIDVSEPGRPRRIAELPAGGVGNGISLHGRRLFIAADFAGMVVEDLTSVVRP